MLQSEDCVLFGTKMQCTSAQDMKLVEQKHGTYTSTYNSTYIFDVRNRCMPRVQDFVMCLPYLRRCLGKKKIAFSVLTYV